MPTQELKPDEVAPQELLLTGLQDEPNVSRVAEKLPVQPSFEGWLQPPVPVQL